MKVIIIGGGAGGAGTAARIRRRAEDAKISIYEASSAASYSNCGLPYKFSDEVEKFEDLLVTTPEELKNQYNLDVFVRHEVIDIDPTNKKVSVKNLKTGEVFDDNYDELVLAHGVRAIKPRIKGIETVPVFSLKTPDDVKRAEEFTAKNNVKNITVIGAGFIGSEIAENYKVSGYNVNLVDAAEHLLPNSVDGDIASHIHEATIKGGINLILGKQAVELNPKEVILDDGTVLPTDMIFLTVGVAVEQPMLTKAGLAIGSTRGVIVDRQQRTNIPNIYAVGDIAETINYAGEKARILLALPASRQGVVAGNTITNYVGPDGKEDLYKGVTGAATLKMFDTAIASVGKTEKQLKAAGIKYNKTLNARAHKIAAVVGSRDVWLKVLYDDNFKILGAQAVGPETTEKRISYMSLAMQNNIPLTAFEDFMVAYSPTSDTHYDATNMAARLARHQADGSLESVFPEDLEDLLKDGYTLIDVREPYEWAEGNLDIAKKISMSEMREKMHELDKDGKYVLHCKTGARSYNTILFMKKAGFKHLKNMAGGYKHMRTVLNYSNLNK